MPEALSPPAPAPSARPLRPAAGLLWALALALPLFIRLGAMPLFDVDEGAFSEATREMLLSGDFGHTTLNGEPRFDKPIAVYWLQAVSVWAFGLNEWALRLPSALCAWLACLAAAAFALPRWGRTAAIGAGVILATALGPLVMGRVATADALLNLLLMLTALDLWRHLDDGGVAPLRRCAIWMGLGMLTKGPVALLIPFAAWLLWLLSTPAARRAPWPTRLSALRDPLAWALLLGIALPWYVYAWSRHGMAFIDGFFMRHNVQRFSNPLEGHTGGWVYHWLLLPLLWLPWSPLLAALALRWRWLWREPLTRYLLLWAGFVLVFFSLAGTKLPHYGLYAGPGLALLLARLLSEASGTMRRALQVGILGILLLAAGGPWLVLAQAADISEPFYRALFLQAPQPWLPTMLALVLAAVLAVGFYLRRKNPSELTIPVAALAASAWLCGFGAPWWGEALQGPIQRTAWAAKDLPAPVLQWNVHWPSVAVYMNRQAPRREPAAGEYAISRSDELTDKNHISILREERGVVLLQRLAPGPQTRPGEKP